LEGGLYQQGVERAGAQVVVTHQSDAIFEVGLEQLL
jgi:hypothetical protein